MDLELATVKICSAVEMQPWDNVAQLDALVSFLLPAALQRIVLGLIGKTVRSDTAVGPKLNRNTMLHGSQR